MWSSQHYSTKLTVVFFEIHQNYQKTKIRPNKSLKLLVSENSGGFQKIPRWVWHWNVDFTTWEDMWNQEMAISRGLPHLDLHLKSAFLHSKMSKVLFSANLLGHCYHSQEPIWWFIWLSMHWAFTPESNSDTQKKCTTKVQISSHMAS